MSDIVARLQNNIKEALKSGDKDRTNILRLVLSAVKQKQIDSGTAVDEAGLISIVEKMIKQREDSIQHYQQGGRADLEAQEKLEINLLQPFMPARMSDADLTAAIEEVILESGADSIKDMGKIMAVLKPRLAGRADMTVVSRLVKEKLSPSG